MGRGQPDHFDQWICEEDTENTPLGNRPCRPAAARLPEPESQTLKDDLDKHISRRQRTDQKFAGNLESGYREFKVGVLLRQAREQAGITQEDLAQRTKTRKSAISRLENHAEDVPLSTIERVAHALRTNLVIQLVEA
jgi:ribosome-binding protein aMBF1 (putative translation factor)